MHLSQGIDSGLKVYLDSVDENCMHSTIDIIYVVCVVQINIWPLGTNYCIPSLAMALRPITEQRNQ